MKEYTFSISLFDPQNGSGNYKPEQNGTFQCETLIDLKRELSAVSTAPDNAACLWIATPEDRYYAINFYSLDHRADSWDFLGVSSCFDEGDYELWKYETVMPFLITALKNCTPKFSAKDFMESYMQKDERVEDEDKDNMDYLKSNLDQAIKNYVEGEQDDDPMTEEMKKLGFFDDEINVHGWDEFLPEAEEGTLMSQFNEMLNNTISKLKGDIEI